MKSKLLWRLMWIFLAGAVVVSYLRVPGIFFQQDEILGFGLFIKEGSRIILSGLNPGVVMHFVPLTMSLSYFLYSLFGPNYFVYNSVSLFFHLINAVLVYLTAVSVLKRKSSQLIAVAVFITSSSAAELLMWPVINLNVISLTFSLLSWLLVINENFAQKITGVLRMSLITSLFLLSIFSVEYGAGFAFFIPLTYILLRQGSLRDKLKKLTPFILGVFVYCLLRLIPLTEGSGFSSGFSSAGLPIYIRWAYLVPRYFGQLFFSQHFILWLSGLLSHLYPLSINEVFIEAKIYPIVSFVLGVLIIVFSGIFYSKKAMREGKKYAKTFLLITFSIAFSALPFLLIPGEAGSFSIFSSRYMYFGLFGLAIYLGFINDLLTVNSKSVSAIGILIFSGALILSGTLRNFEKGESLYRIGKMRLRIIKFVDGSIPNVPQKLIIYTESSQSYYGLPGEEKIMPFQSGFGQTLLIFLGTRARFPLEFYPGWGLWEIMSQGYLENEERGFGYFRDLKLLEKAINENKIPEDSLYAFSWNGNEGAIVDISDRIRHEIYR